MFVTAIDPFMARLIIKHQLASLIILALINIALYSELFCLMKGEQSHEQKGTEK